MLSYQKSRTKFHAKYPDKGKAIMFRFEDIVISSHRQKDDIMIDGVHVHKIGQMMLLA